MAKWLACWAAVRQSQVRFPPGTPPSAQQEENYLPRCRSHLPSSGRKYTQQENIPRKYNVCIVREITKINKKSAGHGTNIEKKVFSQRDTYLISLTLLKFSFFKVFILSIYVFYSTLIHLPPLRVHCAG